MDGAARDLFTFRYPADLAGGAPVTLSAGFAGATAAIGATRGDLSLCGTSVVHTSLSFHDTWLLRLAPDGT